MASMNYSNVTTTRRSTSRGRGRGQQRFATRKSSSSSKNQYNNNVQQNLQAQELQFLQQQFLEYKLQKQQEFERQELLIQQKKQEDYLLQLQVKKIQEDHFLQQELQKQLQKQQQQLYTKYPAGDPYSTYERKEWEERSSNWEKGFQKEPMSYSDEQLADDVRFIMESGMYDSKDYELKEEIRVLAEKCDQEEEWRKRYAKLTSFLYSSSSTSSSYCEPLFGELGFESFFEKQVLDFASCPINQKRNVRSVDQPRVARSKFY